MKKIQLSLIHIHQQHSFKMHRAKSDKLQEVGIATIVVRNLNTSLLTTDRTTREKISSDTELSNGTNQENLSRQSFVEMIHLCILIVAIVIQVMLAIKLHKATHTHTHTHTQKNMNT